MSTLTKVFVVLLVVLSLLLAAASVTFLNTLPDYQDKIANLEAAQKAAVADQARLQSAAAAQAEAAQQRATQLSNQLSQTNEALARLRSDLAQAQAQVADLEGQLAMANATESTLAQAVTASTQQVDQLQQQVAQLRNNYDQTLQQFTETSRQMASVQNRLLFTTRALRNAKEQNKALLDQNAQFSAALQDLGRDPENLTVEQIAPPPINGVIVQRDTVAGQPYAVISVGREDDVTEGMRFTVLDPQTNSFLGFVTVERVDDQVSIGRLSGPNVEQIGPDDQVRTQLSPA